MVSEGKSEKLSFKEVHEPCSTNDRGHTHEEQRLRIEELDEWRAHKPRTYDKLKLRQNKANTSPNQLKFGDKVLLDAADPHIVTTTPNEEIPLTILSIFSFGTVEVSHSKFGTFKHTRPGTWASLKSWPNRGRDTAVQYGSVEAGHAFPKTRDVINPHGLSFRQSTEEEAYEDIPDDVPPQYEGPPTQPPPPSRPVHAVASYADISERLTRFKQQCFQLFDNIDATLQQICQQHLHISLPVPPRELSSDEDV
ncbi:hypothetical protein GOBAR_AA22625 [Gossypium barbadense]|uniref:Uncharacterized protein n=1 Tax=Gossypium barbadense TaxID=3634 RepID=A0A2P5X3Z7_GOSBA|nr:hypothetical protein GOBAR_AA22625 [Gossypium barbadense]